MPSNQAGPLLAFKKILVRESAMSFHQDEADRTCLILRSGQQVDTRYGHASSLRVSRAAWRDLREHTGSLANGFSAES
jgi:hypothetical protein